MVKQNYKKLIVHYIIIWQLNILCFTKQNSSASKRVH